MSAWASMCGVPPGSCRPDLRLARSFGALVTGKARVSRGATTLRQPSASHTVAQNRSRDHCTPDVEACERREARKGRCDGHGPSRVQVVATARKEKESQ